MDIVTLIKPRVPKDSFTFKPIAFSWQQLVICLCKLLGEYCDLLAPSFFATFSNPDSRQALP